MTNNPNYKDRFSALLCVVAAFFTAQLGGIALLWLLRGCGSGFLFNLMMNIVCILGVNVLVFALFCKGIHLPQKKENYSPLEPFAFFFAALLFACVASLLSKAIIPPEAAEGTGSSKSMAEYALYLCYSLVLAPIAEESAFRGAALSKLSSVFGENSAAVGSALLFAAYHMDIRVFAYMFALGFFLAILAQRSGSLLPCIIAHAANNMLTVAVGFSDVISSAVNIAVPILGVAALAWLILTGRLFGK